MTVTLSRTSVPPGGELLPMPRRPDRLQPLSGDQVMSWLPPSEFCPEFVEGMKNRMAVSYAKYGPVAAGFPAKVDAIESLRERLDKYIDTGNTEWLIDVANFAMIEFMHPAHPRAHFRPTDSDESPGRYVRDDAAARDDSNANLSDEPWRESQKNRDEGGP